MFDEAMQRLLDFDRRRYWLVNGWSIRFRIAEVEVSAARPRGIKYAFTLWASITRTAFRRPKSTSIDTASGTRSSSWHTSSAARTS